MHILTGSFENIENAYLSYNGSITNKLTIVVDNVSSEIDDNTGGQNAVFTLYTSEDNYNTSSSFGDVTSPINGLDNWNTASEEAIINYVQGNDPRFTNLKLL